MDNNNTATATAAVTAELAASVAILLASADMADTVTSRPSLGMSCLPAPLLARINRACADLRNAAAAIEGI